MKLEELMPLLKTSSLHDNVLDCAIMLDVDGKLRDLSTMQVRDYAKYLKREVVGISTWLPFTIFLKDILED